MAPKSPWSKKSSNVVLQRAAAEASSPAIDYNEVQQEECDVLQAIYMEDFEEVEVKSAWSKTTDRSFKLTLRSSSDSDSFVVLSVQLTATYPKSQPLLEVSGLDAYHERTQKRIQRILENRPKQLLGEVMIHVIAGEIQDALEDAVSARQQGTLPSLEEERANAEEVASTLAKKAEEAEARRQREAQEEEDRVLKQMVDEELTRREKRKPSKVLHSRQTSTDNHVSFDQVVRVQASNDVVEFNKVTILYPLSEHRDEQLYLGQPEVDNTPLVAVKKLTVHKTREDILAIESTLEAISKARQVNILALLAYRVDRLDTASSQVTLCSEYADRGTLRELLEIGGLHIGKARQFTIELLEALDYLHHHGIAHGTLSINSVYLASNPLSPRLGRLGQWMLQSEHASGLVPTKWQAPETVSIEAASRRSTDIWNLGVIVVQMLFGLHAVDDYSSPHTMLGRLDVSDTFDDFARKVFFIDVKKRPSAFDLLPSEFLRTDTPLMGEPPLSTAKSHRKSSSAFISPIKRRSRHNSSNIMEPMSRYAQDFTEIGRLGKGGFGEVVKARNKLDGGIYALKKVKQAPQLLDQVLSEVMLLNRLNHPYVVRYFSTWVETDLSGAIYEDDTTTSATVTTEEATVDDESSDGPRMDFGYQSTGGLDFVSSSGYPQIEFGGDEDDETSDDATAEEPGEHAALDDDAESSSIPRMRSGKPRSDSQRLPSILYIQMEYCERRTLRDLVRKGMSAEDSWRFVRQITEGLAHIHGHGIIHRDLKPDNVFIDVAGNPKIGDFGLATTSQSHLIDKTAINSGQSAGDMTRSVGTAMYVAPELRSGSGGTYTDKVDMYSLGIMFYEMCEHFGTAMERIRSLQSIREKGFELPQNYHANGEQAAQGKMIGCLISHKPSERPSSAELLRSDMMPLKIEDETIRQALSGLSDPRSPYHQKMMSALFAHDGANSGRVKALAWDAKGPATVETSERLRLRSVARRAIESVFRRHGAEEARRESIFPRSGYYTDPKVVQLMDSSGHLLQLPYDLTLPNARQLARQTPSVKRTFVFGAAYRDALGGPPKASEEVDFDVTQCAPDDEPALDEAEAMKVMDEIVSELPAFAASTNVCFHLNHSAILDAILDQCRVPLPQQTTVKETVSRLGFHKWTWPKVRAELRKFGLPDTTLDDLEQFDFRDAPEKAFSRMQDVFINASSRLKHKLEHGIRALGETLALVRQLDLQRPIYVAPLGSVNSKFYEDGMLFQCVLERKSNRTVIAAGGRYDSLIHAHRSVNGSVACRGAVGVCIGMDPIIGHMAKNSGTGETGAFLKHRRTLEPLPKRCDVCVEAIGSEALQGAGLKILISLWSRDISAEMISTGRPQTDAQYAFIITVRHEASNTVKLTNTTTRAEDADVPISTLVSRVQQELRDMKNSKPRQPAFVRQTSHQDHSDRKSNVQVLMSQHRSKKSNKYHIVAEAQQRWAERVEGWKEAPILAVETRDDVIEMIRDTKLSDPETWRKAVQGVQLNERQYLQQVQDILGSWRKKWSEGDGEREACIFNFRTGHCIYYDLGL